MHAKEGKVSVTIRYFAVVRELAGVRDESFVLPKNTRLQHAIKEASKRHGQAFFSYLLKEDGEISDRMMILVNGKAVRRKELREFVLRDNDVVAILPPVGGG